MDDWNGLLSHLASFPRENGTPAIHRTASYLEETLRARGLQVHSEAFTAYPYEARVMGGIILLACVAYFVLMRRGRWLAAGLLALFTSLLPVAMVEFHLPLSGGIGAEVQHNIVATLPAAAPRQRIILAAHYDTKTDLFDHVVRAPIQAAGLPLCVLMIVVAFALRSRRGRVTERLGKWTALAALAYGPLFFLAYSAGAWVPARSPGALDDGAACAVLVRTAGEFAQGPPLRQTELQVVFFSGEEIGTQGATDYVKRGLVRNDGLPVHVVNLDPVGASTRLAVLGADSSMLRSYPPDPRIVASLDAALHQVAGKSLTTTWHGGYTDSVPFRAQDIPAATLVSEVPTFVVPRGLHSARDTRNRVDVSSLDLTQRLLVTFVRSADVQGWWCNDLGWRRALPAPTR